ncbi:unnamed protein product [Chrysoparadoxa australica]
MASALTEAARAAGLADESELPVTLQQGKVACEALRSLVEDTDDASCPYSPWGTEHCGKRVKEWSKATVSLFMRRLGLDRSTTAKLSAPGMELLGRVQKRFLHGGSMSSSLFGCTLPSLMLHRLLFHFTSLAWLAVWEEGRCLPTCSSGQISCGPKELARALAAILWTKENTLEHAPTEKKKRRSRRRRSSYSGHCKNSPPPPYRSTSPEQHLQSSPPPYNCHTLQQQPCNTSVHSASVNLSPTKQRVAKKAYKKYSGTATTAATAPAAAANPSPYRSGQPLYRDHDQAPCAEGLPQELRMDPRVSTAAGIGSINAWTAPTLRNRPDALLSDPARKEKVADKLWERGGAKVATGNRTTVCVRPATFEFRLDDCIRFQGERAAEQPQKSHVRTCRPSSRRGQLKAAAESERKGPRQKEWKWDPAEEAAKNEKAQALLLRLLRERTATKSREVRRPSKKTEAESSWQRETTESPRQSQREDAMKKSLIETWELEIKSLPRRS